MFLLYGNQSIGLQGKSIDWFLFYMRGTLVEKGLGKDLLQNRASVITNGGDYCCRYQGELQIQR